MNTKLGLAKWFSIRFECTLTNYEIVGPSLNAATSCFNFFLPVPFNEFADVLERVKIHCNVCMWVGKYI